MGVGADGLIIATLGSEVSMILFNADGSQAEMSGNGIRCLAGAVRHATHAKWDSLEVHTSAGLRTVSLEMNEYSGSGSVDMGEVTFGESIEGALGVAYVGNPHVVVRDDAAWSDAQREQFAAAWSEQIGGANVEFVTVNAPERVNLRVIERGVGWTLACGTGSCAVAAVLHRDGLVGDDVVVENPGGALRVRLEGARAELAGPVQFIANVEWLEA
jgi:diaminopimelate epimerase